MKTSDLLKAFGNIDDEHLIHSEEKHDYGHSSGASKIIRFGGLIAVCACVVLVVNSGLVEMISIGSGMFNEVNSSLGGSASDGHNGYENAQVQKEAKDESGVRNVYVCADSGALDEKYLKISIDGTVYSNKNDLNGATKSEEAIDDGLNPGASPDDINYTNNNKDNDINNEIESTSYPEEDEKDPIMYGVPKDIYDNCGEKIYIIDEGYYKGYDVYEYIDENGEYIDEKFVVVSEKTKDYIVLSKE